MLCWVCYVGVLSFYQLCYHFGPIDMIFIFKSYNIYREYNFKLSMREAMRVDLRNGKAVREKLRASKEDSGASLLSTHPEVRAVVQSAMQEQSPGPFADGNWGLWNFNGNGPLGAPPPVVAGEPGGSVEYIFHY